MPWAEIPDWLQPLWGHWQEVRREGRLPHAMLVAGPSGSGKRDLVEAFVRGMQCHAPVADGLPCGQCPSCKQFPSRLQLEEKSHPDVGWLTISRYSIGIGEIRDQIIRRLGLKANYDRTRALVIEPVERMTQSAANALLKSLEEPPEDTVLILISHQPGRLLPTIRSRCQRHVVPQPDAEQALDWLCGFMSREEAGRATAAAGGMPIRALAMHQAGQVEFRDEFERDLDQVLSGTQLETAFASKWCAAPAQGKGPSRTKGKGRGEDADEAAEDIPMDLRLTWMLERGVSQVREKLAQAVPPAELQSALHAYQELLEVRAREAGIPAPQLNLEAACLALRAARAEGRS